MKNLNIIKIEEKMKQITKAFNQLEAVFEQAQYAIKKAFSSKKMQELIKELERKS